MSYVTEKIGTGLQLMATSTLPLQQRYARAWLSGIYLLKPEDIHAEMRPRFEQLKLDLQTVEDEERGAIAASADLLTDEQIIRAVDHLFVIYHWNDQP